MKSEFLKEYYEGQAVRIGNKKQLLIDDYIIEDRFNVKRRHTKPVRYAGNPVLKADRQWENHLVYCPCVIFDNKSGLYKMWYFTWNKENYFKNNGMGYYMMYAESRDGYSWDKPSLNKYMAGKYGMNNIVYICQNGRVFIDEKEKDPNKKYKLIHVGGMQGGGVQLAFSPDGIEWTPYEDNPVIDFHSDCYNNVLFNSNREKWQYFLRPVVFSSGRNAFIESVSEKRHRRRRVAVCESDDLINWTMPRCILYPDEIDMPDIDAISVFEYEGCLFGMLNVFNGDGEKSGQAFKIMLAFSRDGLKWERLPDRPVYIGHGNKGSFESCSVSASGYPVRLNEGDITFYYSGRTWDESGSFHISEGAIGMARIREDGFVEQYSDEKGGWLLTREIYVEGGSLEVNYYTKAADSSYILAELLEAPGFDDRQGCSEGGRLIEGYSFSDCEKLKGDFTSQKVKWNKSEDISRLRDKKIYIRFYLKDASLYSFRICD